MRSKSDKMFCVPCINVLPCHFIGFVWWIVAIAAVAAVVAVVIAVSIKQLCVCLCIAFHFVGVCAPAIESNSIRYSRILALLAYNFTLACHITPHHTNIHTERDLYSEHNVQDVYADYNQTNLLYYYSYAIYFIYTYYVCVCVYMWVHIGIEVNGKLFAIVSVRM